MVRQLVALGYVRAEGEFNTLELTQTSRAVLRGEVTLLLREASDKPRRSKSVKSAKGGRTDRTKDKAPPVPLDESGLSRFGALKSWRAEVAREHNLPAFVVFHDATLAAMAREAPATLDELAGISGVGAKKLDAYGREILRVLGDAGG